MMWRALIAVLGLAGAGLVLWALAFFAEYVRVFG
jgi:hypothetical protein